MGLRGNLNSIIRIWLAVITFQHGHSENVEPRALDLSVPWRPMPYHVPQQQLQQSQQPQQLISVASFDTTSKDELVHIAQHNAQILKQFNQPIAQYSQHPQGGMKVQITTHQQAPGPGPSASVQQHHHHHHHAVQSVPASSFGHTPAAPPKYMTTPLLQTIYPAGPHKQQSSPPQSKPFVKSDQITTLNMVHSSTPKITAAISTHGAVGVKSAKFNGQFRDVAPTIVQKSTLKPHPVMNKLQSHMAISGFRQKQPIATSSNRLEHFINPNHLYGTYIQFGQSPALSPASLPPAKTKFLSQLNSGVPTFDSQTLKSFFSAPGYTPAVGQFKKLNFIHQQQTQQLQPGGSGAKFSFPHFNQIPADLAEFPKKYVTPSSAEKELSKTVSGGIDSTPLFPHLPPSVLTPFFQQVQQQQQHSSSSFISGNKYNSFNLKTQQPAPPVSSQTSSSGASSTKHGLSQGQFQSERESLSAFGGQVFSGGAFGTYSTQQPLPIEHKPYEIVKFKESPGKQLATKFNEIHDEYSKNLVPPPPSTQQAFLPTVLNHLSESSPSKDPIEILNKYNINPHSPLQDANRFSYEFPRPTSVSQAAPTPPSTVSTKSTTTTTQFPTATTLPRQQYYQHHYNQFQFPGEQSYHNHQPSLPVLVTPVSELNDGGWLARDKYLTTEKPNVFKNLFRPLESEYKQHKLMHPSYTGLPPNRRPSSTASSTTTAIAASAGVTTNSPWDQSTEEPIITHSFFTIEDAIADPTLIPPKSKNKYKYTTDAEEENRQDDLQLEIVTIGPFIGSEESPIQQVITTPAPSRGHGSKGGNGQHRRRRPKPPQGSTTTEYTTEQESTESTTNAFGGVNNRNRDRIRFRPKPVTTVPPPIAAIVETEPATTIIPTPPPLPTFVSSEEFDGTVVKKFRKKPHFTRNRFNVLSQREEEKIPLFDQTEPSLATPIVTTSSSTTTAAAGANVLVDAPPSVSTLGGGFRSRYRPAPAAKGKGESQEDTGDGVKVVSRLPSRLPPTGVSSTVTTSTDAAAVAVFNSDESNVNFSEPQNRTRGGGGELNRPRFSIKEYRNKLNRTTTVSTATPTSTVGSPVGDLETTTAPKLRFPTRNRFLLNARLNKTAESNEIAPTGAGATTEKSANETTTRSSFRPHGTRTYNRFTVKKPSTETPAGASTNAASGTRGQTTAGSNLANRGRTKTAYDQAVAANRTASGSTFNTTASLINRRPPKITLRQRIQNYNRKKEMEQTAVAATGSADDEPLKREEASEIASVDQNSVLASSGEQNRPIDDLGSLGDRFGSSNSGVDDVTTRASTTEGYRHHETAIMKISPKDSNGATATNGEDYDLNSASSDYSKRVVELTLSGTGNKDRTHFKSVNKGLLSRKVPGYFTLATEDPILPIEAFFPQVKKPSGGLA